MQTGCSDQQCQAISENIILPYQILRSAMKPITENLNSLELQDAPHAQLTHKVTAQGKIYDLNKQKQSAR